VFCRALGRANAVDGSVDEVRRSSSAEQAKLPEEPTQRTLDAAAVLALLDVPAHPRPLVSPEVAADVGRQAVPREEVIEVEARPRRTGSRVPRLDGYDGRGARAAARPREPLAGQAARGYQYDVASQRRCGAAHLACTSLDGDEPP